MSEYNRKQHEIHSSDVSAELYFKNQNKLSSYEAELENFEEQDEVKKKNSEKSNHFPITIKRTKRDNKRNSNSSLPESHSSSSITIQIDIKDQLPQEDENSDKNFSHRTNKKSVGFATQTHRKFSFSSQDSQNYPISRWKKLRIGLNVFSHMMRTRKALSSSIQRQRRKTLFEATILAQMEGCDEEENLSDAESQHSEDSGDSIQANETPAEEKVKGSLMSLTYEPSVHQKKIIKKTRKFWKRWKYAQFHKEIINDLTIMAAELRCFIREMWSDSEHSLWAEKVLQENFMTAAEILEDINKTIIPLYKLITDSHHSIYGISQQKVATLLECCRLYRDELNLFIRLTECMRYKCYFDTWKVALRKDLGLTHEWHDFPRNENNTKSVGKAECNCVNSNQGNFEIPSSAPRIKVVTFETTSSHMNPHEDTQQYRRHYKCLPDPKIIPDNFPIVLRNTLTSIIKFIENMLPYHFDPNVKDEMEQCCDAVSPEPIASMQPAHDVPVNKPKRRQSKGFALITDVITAARAGKKCNRNHDNHDKIEIFEAMEELREVRDQMRNRSPQWPIIRRAKSNAEEKQDSSSKDIPQVTKKVRMSLEPNLNDSSNRETCATMEISGRKPYRRHRKIQEGEESEGIQISSDSDSDLSSIHGSIRSNFLLLSCFPCTCAPRRDNREHSPPSRNTRIPSSSIQQKDRL